MIQKLKDSVELKFGRKISYQKDCKDLSDKVLKSTSKLISPSTLRRFYGFLSTNSNPSRVTLDILSLYCGYNNWDDFKKNNSESAPDNCQPIIEVWVNASESAEQINYKQLEIQKKKFAIEYHSTISRGYLEERMQLYIDSPFNAMPIIGPSGIGKTLAIAKWMDDYKKTYSDKPAIILYLGTSMIDVWLSKDLTIDEWLLQILNVSNSNFFKSLENNLGHSLGKFILFIDGIDEHIGKKNKLDRIINALENFTLKYSGSWFKLIVACRFYSWNQISNQLPLNNSWCFVSSDSINEEGSNIPRLNRNEIQEIFDGTINLHLKQRLLTQEIDNSILDIISHPGNLDLFFNLLGKDPQISNIFKTDIISEILKREVVQSQYPDECLDILYVIAEISGKAKSLNSAKKNDLKEVYPIHLKLAGNYFTAYEYLLSTGLVVEYISESQLGVPTKYVKITGSDIYCYLSLIKLVDNQEQIDFKLFETIESKYSGSIILPELLTMLFGIAYKSKQIQVLKQFFSLSDTTLSNFFKFSSIQKIIASDELVAKELIPFYLENPKARKYLVETNTNLNTIVCCTKQYIENYQSFQDSSIELLIGKTLEFCTKTYELNFSWINEFNSSFTIKYPPISTSPRIAGLWFQCRIVANYFTVGIVDKEIESNIQEFKNLNSTTWDKNDYNEFTLSIIFGFLLAKRYDLAYKIIESTYSPTPEKSATPEEKALTIYLEYTRWRNTYQFDIDKMKEVEHQLLDLPEWISHQTYILGTSWLAMFYLFQGNLEKAHYLYQNAIEMSNIAGYKVLEMKLLKNLSQILNSLGENERALECDELVKSLSAQSNVDFSLL